MAANGQVGRCINGKESGIFANQQDMKKFISSAILGKVPMYYNVGTVFDVKDEKGEIVKNRGGGKDCKHTGEAGQVPVEA